MQVGDKIPEIFGVDQDGKEIKASDYRGRKIILYTYPKANTPGCTAEACSLQAHKEELAAAGYAVVGVSKDRVELQKKFADKQGLDFPLIADTETTFLQSIGAWGGTCIPIEAGSTIRASKARMLLNHLPLYS